MMTSFYNLLKYAQTGIASPDMTYFDRMRASMLMGGVVQTLTGIPPLSFQSDGTPLISLSMKGNGSQTGTPSPQNIIIPTFCGDRTGNLWDEDYTGANINAIYRSVFVGDGTFTLSTTFQDNNGITDIFLLPGIATSGISSSTNGAYAGKNITTQSIDGYVTIAYRKNARTGAGAIDKCETMLNLGSTALDYEPYGWAEKITCAGQTVPVYLGQVSTVRRVKKLVLTGEEYVYTYTNADIAFRVNTSDMVENLRTQGYCSHFSAQYTPGHSTVDGITFGASDKNLYFTFSAETAAALGIVAKDTTSFKTWLAAQYAAGTPVTVWYVLAEPETGIVNEPLAKIGDYADELHSEDTTVTIPTIKGQNTLTVEGDLPPSSMTITYKS